MLTSSEPDKSGQPKPRHLEDTVVAPARELPGGDVQARKRVGALVEDIQKRKRTLLSSSVEQSRPDATIDLVPPLAESVFRLKVFPDRSKVFRRFVPDGVMERLSEIQLLILKQFFQYLLNEIMLDEKQISQRGAEVLVEDMPARASQTEIDEEVLNDALIEVMRRPEFRRLYSDLSADVATAYDVSPEIIENLKDRYLFLGEIGSGGSGTVFLVEQVHLQRLQALKIVRLAKDLDRVFFEREVKLMATLQDPRIVRIVHADIVDDHGVLVMEFVEGEDLHTILDCDDILPIFSPPEGQIGVVEIMIQIFEALEFLHHQASPIVHRDVKPANVLFDGKAVKVTDFGIAMNKREALRQILGEEKRVDDSANDEDTRAFISDSQQGVIIGSIPYMSPEQIQDKEPDIRSDVYSAGVTFFELLACELPYSARTTQGLIIKILQEEPMTVRLLREDVPQVLSDLIAMMLEKNPNDRPEIPGILAKLKTLQEEWRSGKIVINDQPVIQGPGTRKMRVRRGKSTLSPEQKKTDRMPIEGEALL